MARPGKRPCSSTKVCWWVELGLLGSADWLWTRDLTAKDSLQGVLLAKGRGHVHAFLDGGFRDRRFCVQTYYCFAGVIRLVVIGMMGDWTFD